MVGGIGRSIDPSVDEHEPIFDAVVNGHDMVDKDAAVIGE